MVLQHQGARLRDVADAYRAALLAIGYTPRGDRANGNSHTLTFTGPNGDARVALASVAGGVQAYLGG